MVLTISALTLEESSDKYIVYKLRIKKKCQVSQTFYFEVSECGKLTKISFVIATKII